MAITERLALIVDLNGAAALHELDKIGDTAERQLGRMENKLERAGTKMVQFGTGGMAVAGMLGAALWKAGDAASDLNEEVSQSAQIFGPAASAIDDFAKGAEAIGQSERQAHAAANTFGLFFTNAGKSKGEAADMSVTMSKLASDMASFKNTTPEEAIEALGAALRGESEPIRRYGVMLDEATLKNRALEMGLVSTTSGTLPPAIKMQAAYAEILAQTTTIQGDFTRTQDGQANSQRRLAAEFENAKAKLGEGFLPVMQKVIGAASTGVDVFNSLDEASGGTVGTIASVAVVGLGAVGVISTMVGWTIKMKDNFTAASTAVKGYGSQIAGVGAAVAAVAAGVAMWKARQDELTQGTRDTVKLYDDNLRAGALSYDQLAEGYNRAQVAFEGYKKDAGDVSWYEVWNLDVKMAQDDNAESMSKLATNMAVTKGMAQGLASAYGISYDEALKMVSANEKAGRAMDDGAGLAETQSDALEEQSKQFDKARQAMKDYFDEASSLVDVQLSARDANLEFTTGVQENGLSLDELNDKGRENIRNLQGSVDAWREWGAQQIQSGADIDWVTGQVNAQIGGLRNWWGQMGGNTAVFDAWLGKLRATPADVTTAFHQPGLAEGVANLQAFNGQLNLLSGRRAQLEQAAAFFQAAGATTLATAYGNAAATLGRVEGYARQNVPGRAMGGTMLPNTPYMVDDGVRRERVVETSGTGGYVDTFGGGGAVRLVLTDEGGRILAEGVAPHLVNRDRGLL